MPGAGFVHPANSKARPTTAIGNPRKGLMVATIPRGGPPARMGHNRLVAESPKIDTALVAARELAFEAAVDEAGTAVVGEHIDVFMEDERVATHMFACTNPGYVGWRWAVTVTRAPRAKQVTVNDVVLLPGPESIIAPPWVPWSERLQPGDLGVGDVLPTAPDDLRLVPGYTGWDDLLDPDATQLPSGWQIGLGRERVLSPMGRDDAADRWFEGDMGPAAEMALAVNLQCSTCGFMAPLAGVFGQAFGVCANRMSPADGRVVALSFGCGAHSQIAIEDAAPLPEPASDELGWDALELGHS